MSFSQAFTVGTDVTVDLYDPQDGSITRVTGLTNFSPKPRTKLLESHLIDKTDKFAAIYLGWDLSFDYDRYDGVLDRYFAGREARYRSGLPQGVITITQTIQERDGSISQYRFTGVELVQENTGEYQREEMVTGSITGTASKRELV